VDIATPASGHFGYRLAKIDHPELIVFEAITGVPLAIPTLGSGASAPVDWDGLLGRPSFSGPDDFCGRDSSVLARIDSAEGPISMAQANPDPACPDRVVPACRQEGTTYDPAACTMDQQYFAWPARRIVEVARRFDQMPLCAGAPCHNGLVASICAASYHEPLARFSRRIAERLPQECLPNALVIQRGSNDEITVGCRVFEIEPAGLDACDVTTGRLDPLDANGVPTPDHIDVDRSPRRRCEVAQVVTDGATHAPLAGAGWFYELRANQLGPLCPQRISFTPGARPVEGASARLQCPTVAVAR
jgi:hypothetical protein